MKVKFDVLQNVTIELLNYCNSSCIHCYQKPTKRKCLGIDDIFHIIDQANDAGAMQITITGGEPLLHPNILEIIRYIKNKSMAINLLTSLNYEIESIEEIMSYCDKVGVSIYGSNSYVHDNITRVPGSYKRLLRNLDRISKLDVSISLNITVLNENIADLRNIINMVEQYNYSYRVNYVLHGEASSHHQVSAEQVKNVTSFENNEVLTYNEEMHCEAGRSSLWVDVDLNVYPCVFFKMLLGNLDNQSLKNLFVNSVHLRRLREAKIMSSIKCKTCSLKKYCAPCIGENYNINGDVTIPCKFNCQIAKFRHDLLCF